MLSKNDDDEKTRYIPYNVKKKIKKKIKNDFGQVDVKRKAFKK